MRCTKSPSCGGVPEGGFALLPWVNGGALGRQSSRVNQQQPHGVVGQPIAFATTKHPLDHVDRRGALLVTSYSLLFTFHAAAVALFSTAACAAAACPTAVCAAGFGCTLTFTSATKNAVSRRSLRSAVA